MKNLLLVDLGKNCTYPASICLSVKIKMQVYTGKQNLTVFTHRACKYTVAQPCGMGLA